MTRYVGFDLETTGVSSFTDVPVSYGFVEHLRRSDATETLHEGGYVNPGVPIPPGASAIHGISDVMVAGAQELKDATGMIADRLHDVWSGGGMVVGMNVSYDLTMIDSLCRRLQLPTLEDRGEIGPVMDILIVDRHFDKWRKGARRLSDLCRHYGVILEDAHAAVDDAEASLQVFEVMLDQFSSLGAIPLEDNNSTLGEWYREWLASFSTYLEKKGEAPINRGRYEWPLHREH